VSQRLISLNDDLRQLRQDGYDVAMIKGHLAVRGVPYVNSRREVAYGVLVVQELRLAGDKTLPPTNHVVLFGGEHPCDQNGNPIEEIRHTESTTEIAPDLVMTRTFSSKPTGGYANYHEMLTTYIRILENPAKALGGDRVTAQKHLPAETDDEESVFLYIDTATSRAGLTAINAKLEGDRIGIVGVGGAGAYVLDLVAKTGVREIHLFDGDRLETHNAFRAPGAIGIEDLRQQPNKAAYWRDRYAPLRRGIAAHEAYVTEHNIDELRDLSFVFLCLDSGSAKRTIVAKLEEWDKPFIDVGIGLEKIDDSVVCGQVRTTASLPGMRDHFASRVDYSDAGNGVYRSNLQIAELNAMNATLAVVKWKKIRGFFADLEYEPGSVYMLECNVIANDTP
jgi:hypothetical protein